MRDARKEGDFEQLPAGTKPEERKEKDPKPDVVYRLSGLLPKIERKDLFKADAFCFLVEIKRCNSHTHKSSLLEHRELALGLSWGTVEGIGLFKDLAPQKLLGGHI